MASRLEELYDEDFYLWTRRQADALRRLAKMRPNLDLDLDFPHPIEEVEDLGASQRDAVRSQLRRIIEDCLMLECSRAPDPRAGWYDSILEARAELDDKLSASLRQDLEEQLPRLWARARGKTENSLRRFGEPDAADLLPAERPYALDDLLRDEWYPANRRGLPDDR